MNKIFAIAALLFFSNAFCQDEQFSQYFAASLYLNPGFNGIYNDVGIHINHKRQVQTAIGGIDDEITQASIIFPMKGKSKVERAFGGFGLMAFNQKSGEGLYKRNSIFLNYAHNINFGTIGGYLVSIGAQVGYDLRAFDIAGRNWGTQFNRFLGEFDETRPIPIAEFNTQQQNLVVNAGVMYYFNPDRNYLLYKYSGFVGISATNLNRPNTAFNVIEESVEPILLKYNGGFEFKVKKLFITPSLLFLYLRKNYQFNAGVNLAYAPNADQFSSGGIQLLFGSWYRFRDSFIFMGGVSKNKLVIRISYDTNSKLFAPNKDINIAANSFEISLQVFLTNRNAIKKFSNPLF